MEKTKSIPVQIHVKEVKGQMRKVVEYPLLPLLLMVSLTAAGFNGGGELQTTEEDLISVLSTSSVVHQYENITIIVDLMEKLTLEDVVIVTNIEGLVMGIPPLSEQAPNGDLDLEIHTDIDNDSLIIEMEVVDQMIWFDGKSMLDNITVTLAFLCLYNGTQDLEILNIRLIDVNDPPIINGDLKANPDPIYPGDDVILTVKSVHDKDMDEIELVWRTDGRVLGRERSVVTSFDSPGTYSVILSANDGNATVAKVLSVDVLPQQDVIPDEPLVEDNKTEDDVAIQEEEQGTPWLIIPVILLLIAVVMVLGMALKLKKDVKNDGPKRYLWSMSPLRGPTRYEKETLNGRLLSLKGSEHSKKDPEEKIDEDFEKWASQWSLDIFF